VFSSQNVPTPQSAALSGHIVVALSPAARQQHIRRLVNPFEGLSPHEESAFTATDAGVKEHVAVKPSEATVMNGAATVFPVPVISEHGIAVCDDLSIAV
jgi:hypothetical protein